MSRDLRIRGNDYAGRSHNEPGARLVTNVIQLAGQSPSALDARSHGPECKNWPCVNSASMVFLGLTPSPGALGKPGSEVSGRRNDLVSTYRASMQTGNNLSPGLFASVVAMVSRRRNDLAQFCPAASFVVGLREGRLSERSPADCSRAAQAELGSAVQGDRLSLSFPSRSALKFAQLFNAMVEIAKSFTFFLICLFGGLVITGAALSPFIYLSFFRLH